MTKQIATKGQNSLDAEVVALVMATVLTMENRDTPGLERRIKIRESWPRTTLWRWL